MNLDLILINSLCNTKDINEIKEISLNTNYLRKDTVPVFDYIINTIKEYNYVPNTSLIKEIFQIDFNGVPLMPLKLIEKHLENRYVYENLKNGFKRSIDDFESAIDKDGRGLLSSIYNVMSGIDKELNRNTGAVQILEREFINEFLNNAKNSDMGIPTPFPTLTMRMGGAKPGDLITIAARPSVGKSFMLILWLIEAVKNNKKALFFSTEMTKRQIVNRVLSLATETNLIKISKGELTEDEKIDVINKALKLEGENNFLFMDSGFSSYVEDIEFEVFRHKPDIVAIDGAYLLKTKDKTKDRHSKVAEVVDTLKSIAKRQNIPLIITSQLNRAPETNQKKTEKRNISQGGLERLAFSDNLGMVSDYVFFMEMEEVPENCKDRILNFTPKKMREVFSSDAMSTIKIWWHVAEPFIKEDPFWDNPAKYRGINESRR